jgi:hypothetical protein
MIFRDAGGRLVDFIIDDVNVNLDPADVIDAANAIIAVAAFQPMGAPLAELRGITVIDETRTELEV